MMRRQFSKLYSAWAVILRSVSNALTISSNSGRRVVLIGIGLSFKFEGRTSSTKNGAREIHLPGSSDIHFASLPGRIPATRSRAAGRRSAGHALGAGPVRSEERRVGKGGGLWGWGDGVERRVGWCGVVGD